MPSAAAAIAAELNVSLVSMIRLRASIPMRTNGLAVGIVTSEARSIERCGELGMTFHVKLQNACR
jgi:hypothetical protein